MLLIYLFKNSYRHIKFISDNMIMEYRSYCRPKRSPDIPPEPTLPEHYVISRAITRRWPKHMWYDTHDARLRLYFSWPHVIKHAYEYLSAAESFIRLRPKYSFRKTLKLFINDSIRLHHVCLQVGMITRYVFTVEEAYIPGYTRKTRGRNMPNGFHFVYLYDMLKGLNSLKNVRDCGQQQHVTSCK